MEERVARRVIAQCAAKKEEASNAMTAMSAMTLDVNLVKMRCTLVRATEICTPEGRNTRTS